MFVQLTPDDCTYLLNLIELMDSDTAYTSRQRGYTVPKLQKIQPSGRAARLAFHGVHYLLELIDDDDLPELEQSREMARCQLLDIQNLQNQKFEESKNVEQQRETRRLRRLGTSAALEAHFEHTAPVGD